MTANTPCHWMLWASAHQCLDAVRDQNNQNYELDSSHSQIKISYKKGEHIKILICVDFFFSFLFLKELLSLGQSTGLPLVLHHYIQPSCKSLEGAVGEVYLKGLCPKSDSPVTLWNTHLLRDLVCPIVMLRLHDSEIGRSSYSPLGKVVFWNTATSFWTPNIKKGEHRKMSVKYLALWVQGTRWSLNIPSSPNHPMIPSSCQLNL